MKDLIPMTTEAADVEIKIGQDAVKGSPAVPVSLYLTGDLNGSEKISIQYDGGNGWKTVKANDKELVFDIENNHRAIYAAFEGRLYKPETTLPAGIRISSVKGVI